MATDVPGGAERGSGGAAMTVDERPAAPRSVVSRPRLVELLEAGVRSGGVTLVVGAPGSGKTMAVAEWARGRPAPDLWIGPTRDRTDGTALARLLVAAVGEVDPDLAALIGPCDVADPIARRVLAEALTEVGRGRPGTALVVEDLHRVEHDVARHLGDLVDEVLDAMPVVVVSRSDPPWPLSSWRLRGMVHEVRQRDLDFVGEEAVALLDLVAPGRIVGDRSEEIVARCGGWAAALVMTALSVRDHPEPDAFTAALGAADRSLADYLFDEVLDGLDERSRRVLVACSICEEVDADLAAALSGVDDAAAVLDGLRRSLHLVRPVLDRPGWVRCHDVLRDLLRQQLALAGADEVVRLHRVAAGWFGQKGDLFAHCSHLAAAGDPDALVEAVRGVGRQGFKDVSTASLAACLELIPDHDRGPRVLLLLAEVSLFAGFHWKVDDLLIRARTHPDATPQTLISADRIACVEIEWGRPPAEVVAAADRVLDHVERHGMAGIEQMLGAGDQEALEHTYCALRGRAHDLLGNVDAAIADLTPAHAPEGPRDVAMTLYARASHSLVVARTGAPEAETLARRALAQADELGLVDHPVVAPAHIALAIVHLDAGRLAACDDHLDRCRVACLRNNRWVTRTEEIIWRAERSRRAGDLDEVKARFDDLALLPEPPPALASDIAALRARMLVDEGRPGDAAAALSRVPVETGAVAAARRSIDAASGRGLVEELTSREHDVLRLLVGHLTSAEIADRLVVSIHTVKTHQRHIYQKLGVTSRRDAVAVAVAVGLLPD